jgi:hypothetical protein
MSAPWLATICCGAIVVADRLRHLAGVLVEDEAVRRARA